ncbi:MAG: phenylacetate--CoA ligase family protein [Candidatus Gracilibacteria bacterium]
MLRSTLYYFLLRHLKYPHWEKDYADIVADYSRLNADFLPEILEHTVRHVPFYQNLLGKNDPRKILLENFPILTKNLLRKEWHSFKSTLKKRPGTCLNSSGGATGIPQTFIQDREFYEWGLATSAFYFRQFLKIDEAKVSKVMLWGSERDLFKQNNFQIHFANWCTQLTAFNSFKMSPKEWEHCLDTINTRRPYFIKGYAGSLYELACFIESQKRLVWKPHFIYAAAETLHLFMREKIEKVFKTKVYDFYGSREVGTMAGECHLGAKHIFTFNNFLEVVNADNQPVKVGEEGRILVTTLHNYSMPLIRYEIGDTAILGESCPCGNSLPTLERITGRTTDHFKNKKGDIIHGEYFTHLFYFREWVKTFQVLQEKLDKITLFVVLNPINHGPTPTETQDIEGKIRLVMGGDCMLTWSYVSEVPKTPQGKHLFTRSLIHGK